MGKLIYKEIKNKDIKKWDEFLNQVKNASIYSHSYFERLNKDIIKIKRFFIYDNKEILASFKIFTKKNTICSGKLIYSPINYRNFTNQNRSKIIHKKIAILNKFIEIVTKHFKKGKLDLDYNSNDTREFEWYNFNKKKKIFLVENVRYTTVLDTKKIDTNINKITSSRFFKDCSERTRRQIKKSLNQDYQFKDDFNFEDYKIIIKKTFSRQGKKVDFDLNKNFEIFKKLHSKKLLKMYKTYQNGKVKALMVVSILGKNSIYINGGRISDSSDDYSFTYNLINVFYSLKNLGVEKFDLEGINSPKRGMYKTGFGGKIYPYFSMKFKK